MKKLKNTIVLSLCLCLTVLFAACERSSSSQQITSVTQFNQEQIAAALRTASFRTRLTKPDREDVDEILASNNSKAAYEIFTEKVTGYINSSEFNSVLLNYCQQMFGMKASDDEPTWGEPCDLFVHIVSNDISFKEFLTADYMIDQNGFVSQNHTSNVPAAERAGFLTLRSFLERYYGNDFGFNYVRSLFNIAMCDTFPTSIEYGQWDEQTISQKYANTDDIECAGCHAGDGTNGGINELRQVFIKLSNASGLYNANKDLEDMQGEAAGFEGSAVVEPSVSSGVTASYFTSEVRNVRDLALQVVEIDEFRDCAARRFMTFALGLQSAGAPGVPVGTEAFLPEDLTATSSSDEEMFNRWKKRLENDYDFQIRPFLIAFITSVEWIGRANVTQGD